MAMDIYDMLWTGVLFAASAGCLRQAWRRGELFELMATIQRISGQRAL